MARLRSSGYRSLVSALAAMTVLVCRPDADGTIAGGEPCQKLRQCGDGWVCFENICRKVCNGQQDCAKSEACDRGVCLPVADHECDEDSDCNEPNVCQSVFDAECVAGQCLYEPLERDRDCDDGNACTSNDRCDGAGVCSGEVVACDTPPADSCSAESVFRQYVSPGTCDPPQGPCEYQHHDTPCDDCRHACLHLPRAPRDLVANAGDTQVTLTWHEAADVQSYNVYVSETAGDAATGVPVSVASSPHVQASLTNGVAYYFAVGAVGGAGEGDLAGEVSATPRISAPAQARAVGSDRQVVLTWEPVAGAEAYNLYWSRDPGVTLGSNRETAVTSPFVHAPLLDSTAYHYALTAADRLSESDLSGEVTATTIDPGTKLAAPDAQRSAYFGQSVALSGEYAIVGAPGYDDEGAAYVFRRSGPKSWNSGTKLVPFDSRLRDRAGHAVALDGDYAIVGAPSSGDPGQETGAAYVFRRTDLTAWDAGTKLMAFDAQTTDLFGRAVALDGDCAIVGAPGEDGGEGDPYSRAGAAYVFRRTGPASWESDTKLMALDPQVDDRFGEAVAISGDYAIVGAPEEDGGRGDPARNAGAAYVFHHDGSSWDTGTKLVALDAQPLDYFGCSVALSGERAIVGAYLEDGAEEDPPSNAGAAYVYSRTGPDTWDQGTKLLAPVPEVHAFFGAYVALAGDRAIVGAPGYGRSDDAVTAGAAYVSHFDGSSWATETKLVASDAQLGDELGCSVALGGSWAIAGACQEDGGDGDPSNAAGAAYVFEY